MPSTFARARTREPRSPEAEAKIEELQAAIRDLPPASHDEVNRQLAEAAVEYEETHDPKHLVLFVDSLLMTARLHRTPDYRKALTESEQDSWEGDGVDAADLINATRGKRARRG